MVQADEGLREMVGGVALAGRRRVGGPARRAGGQAGTHAGAREAATSEWVGGPPGAIPMSGGPNPK